MNKCLMMLLQENADLMPTISQARCKGTYPELRAFMEEGEGSGRPGLQRAASKSQNFENFVYPSDSQAGSDGTGLQGASKDSPSTIVEESHTLVPITDAAATSQDLAMATDGLLCKEAPAVTERGTSLAAVDAASNTLRAILEEAVIVDLQQTLASLSLLGESIAALLTALRGDGVVEDLSLASRVSSRGPGTLTKASSTCRPRVLARQPSKHSGDIITDIHLSGSALDSSPRLPGKEC
jgi:hypothetical protein